MSVKHLNTNASFQNGFIPSGSDDRKTFVTDRMSTTMKATERHMETRSTANRGDTRINSRMENS